MFDGTTEEADEDPPPPGGDSAEGGEPLGRLFGQAAPFGATKAPVETAGPEYFSTSPTAVWPQLP